MLPAYAANMAPPFVRFWPGWNPPLSRRWLGSHKTTLGVVSGLLTAVATVFIQTRIGWGGAIASSLGWLGLGLGFGVGAMAGDAIKSFFKRRLGLEPGRPWIPFDQLDFPVGALLLVGPSAELSASDLVVILVVTFAGDIAVNRIAYALGLRTTPW